MPENIKQQIDNLISALNNDNLPSFQSTMQQLTDDTSEEAIDFEVYFYNTDKSDSVYQYIVYMIEKVLRSEKIAFIKALVEKGVSDHFVFSDFSDRFALPKEIYQLKVEDGSYHLPLFWYVALFARPETILYCHVYNFYPVIKTFPLLAKEFSEDQAISVYDFAAKVNPHAESKDMLSQLRGQLKWLVGMDPSFISTEKPLPPISPSKRCASPSADAMRLFNCLSNKKDMLSEDKDKNASKQSGQRARTPLENNLGVEKELSSKRRLFGK